MLSVLRTFKSSDRFDDANKISGLTICLKKSETVHQPAQDEQHVGLVISTEDSKLNAVKNMLPWQYHVI